MDIMQLMGQAQNIVGGIVMIVNGLIIVAMIIPGEQPEKFLHGIADFLSKFSKK